MESKISRLYNKGTSRLEKDFDMLQIIKNVKNLKFLMKKQILSKQILYSKENVISIDSPCSSEGDETSEMEPEEPKI